MGTELSLENRNVQGDISGLQAGPAPEKEQGRTTQIQTGIRGQAWCVAPEWAGHQSARADLGEVKGLLESHHRLQASKGALHLHKHAQSRSDPANRIKPRPSTWQYEEIESSEDLGAA